MFKKMCDLFENTISKSIQTDGSVNVFSSNNHDQIVQETKANKWKTLMKT